ncbi:MAG: T9SS type A sorting domain-containing protein, partial [Bacteroidota bacterium]
RGARARRPGPRPRERKLYYRELIARFGHHLALNWNLGEEHDIWSELNDANQTLIQSYADYIRAVDPYDHHIVLHSYPNQQNQCYNPLLGLNDGLSGVSVQTNFSNVHNDTKKWVSQSAASGHPWVVANDEQGNANVGVPPDPGFGGYVHSGSHPDQDDMREEVLWGNLMAGGAGVEYYFGYSLPHSDLSCQDWRSRDLMWDYTRYALEFFNNYLPFWEMNGADDLVSNGYCFRKAGEVYAVYVPDGLNVPSIDLPTGVYDVQWYNPRSGGALISAPQINGQNNADPGSAPSGDDWVILITNPGSSFPVELSLFEASVQGNEVLLEWQTEREQNSSHFEIERSLDGQAFSQLGQITAAGFSASTQQYQFTDPEPRTGRLFYRLKMVDLDGSFSFSQIRELQVTATSFRLYPNPFTDKLMVQMELMPDIDEDIDLAIFDQLGRQVLAKRVSPDQQSIEVRLSSISKGMYYLQITQQDQLLFRQSIFKQ